MKFKISIMISFFFLTSCQQEEQPCSSIAAEYQDSARIWLAEEILPISDESALYYYEEIEVISCSFDNYDLFFYEMTYEGNKYKVKMKYNPDAIPVPEVERDSFEIED